MLFFYFQWISPLGSYINLQIGLAVLLHRPLLDLYSHWQLGRSRTNLEMSVQLCTTCSWRGCYYAKSKLNPRVWWSQRGSLSDRIVHIKYHGNLQLPRLLITTTSLNFFNFIDLYLHIRIISWCSVRKSMLRSSCKQCTIIRHILGLDVLYLPRLLHNIYTYT